MNIETLFNIDESKMNSHEFFDFLKEKKFRELEKYIEETNFDIATRVFNKLHRTVYKDCPFYNVMCDVGDFEMVKYVFEKNFIPSIVYRHDRFMQACKNGSIGIVELLIQEDKNVNLNHALNFMQMDFVNCENKSEIIERLTEAIAKRFEVKC